jgi:phosphoribosylformylglycinamidine synthase
VFFQGIASMYLPVAHAEGRFVTRNEAILGRLRAAGQLPLRYAPLDGADGAPVPFPANPNGSQADAAGVCDPTGRICGLMPHPERHLDPTHHPHWTRLRELPSEGEGMAVFRNAVAYFG